MKGNLTELGRSMVEMLGVLAVIGVLSIVGLQGYKKAMNKIKANELMDIAVKVYNENLARQTGNPSVAKNATVWALCSNAFAADFSATDDSFVKNRCAPNNLGWDKPSWATLPTFTVYTNIYNFASSTSSATYNIIVFYGIDDCGICNEIAPMLEKYGTHKYRLPNSVTDELNTGVIVNCKKGTDTQLNTSECFNLID